MSFLAVVNRLDVLINRIERVEAILKGEAPPDEVPVPPVEVIVEQLPNRYKLFRVDLSTAHTDFALGLKEILTKTDAEYASYMSIVTAPSAFTFKVNSTDQDAISAVAGLEWEDFEITEIFVTNAALVGTAIIEVEWRVD